MTKENKKGVEETYQTTKEECQKNIDERGNVCDYCGREIVPLKTVDNSGNPTYWAGCMHGTEIGSFTTGVSEEIFKLARKLVLDDEIYYKHMSRSDYNSKTMRHYWIEYQTSGWARLLCKIEHLRENEPRHTKEEFIERRFPGQLTENKK